MALRCPVCDIIMEEKFVPYGYIKYKAYVCGKCGLSGSRPEEVAKIQKYMMAEGKKDFTVEVLR